MTSQELTIAVKKLAKELGADLVGIAPVSRWNGAPAKLRPTAHFPEARSVVVMAVHHPDASIDFGAEPNSNYPCGFQIGMIPKLDTIAFRLTRFIESSGYPTVPYSCTYFWHHRHDDGVKFDHAASFSHINAFVAAGLGEYGWHGMAMSPQYGPRQRIISVFTSAELVPDPLYSGEPLCDRCNRCERACWGKNYTPDALLEPQTVSFSIEDKKIEYANINRWRCFWGEQCHLDMRELASRPNLNEQGIYQALDEGVPRSINGAAGYMCSSLKHCMSKQVRKIDPKLAPNPLRKKAAPSDTPEELKKIIIDFARAVGAERIAVLPMSALEPKRNAIYEGFRTDDFFRRFSRLILLTRRMTPEYLDPSNPLAAENRNSEAQLKNGSLQIATIDIARYLDDHGYEAMQDGAFRFGQFVSEAARWGYAPDAHLPNLIFTDAPLECFDQEIEPPEEIHYSDVSGVAKVDDLPPHLAAPLRKLLPDARSLIVIGTALPKRMVELAGKQEANCAVSYRYSIWQTLRESNWEAQRIARKLSAAGKHSLAMAHTDCEVPGQVSVYVGKIPDLRSQAPLAAAAGLGFIGRNGFLISPKFGPRLRFGFVLTEAELPASKLQSGRCPEGCRRCADACPMNALSGNKELFDRDEVKCEWARCLGMEPGEGASLVGWKQPELPVPERLDDETRKEIQARKDPIQIRAYGHWFQCETPVERCLQACPFV